MSLTPICLFTYNRLDETRRTVEALQKNFLAAESELFVFSDGAKDENGIPKIQEVRDYLKTINGFKKVTIRESGVNKGLANSIISGVSEIIEEYGKIIVLEDDLITSPNFLNFMNQSLYFYEENRKIFSVSGWSLKLESLKNLESDFYVHYRMSSWGWGIWKDRWEKIQFENSYFLKFLSDKEKQHLFKRGGYDMPRMLKAYLKGKNDSWAIRACYHQFENNLLTIAPTNSKVNNIGFGKNATHTTQKNRFDQVLDFSHKKQFIFSNDIILNQKVLNEFKNKFSLWMRLKAKLKFKCC